MFEKFSYFVETRYPPFKKIKDIHVIRLREKEKKKNCLILIYMNHGII
jgi:hypothetical protein